MQVDPSSAIPERDRNNNIASVTTTLSAAVDLAITSVTVERHNAAIRAYNHSEDLGRQMREASKIRNASVKDAVSLNTIEDLDEIHRQLIRT